MWLVPGPDHTRVQTPRRAALGEVGMRGVMSMSAHADQLEAEVRDAMCCVATDRCWACQVKLGEVRAARRDAVLHLVSTVRPRRAAR
jgi:hypothetical protein